MNQLGHISGNWNRVSVDFYRRLVEECPDIPLIQIHNPDSPPYSENMEAAYNAMVKSAKHLSRTGVTHVAIACNTMHIQRSSFMKDTGLFMFDMVSGTKQRAVESGYKQVGIVGTMATMKSVLYESDQFASIYPDETDQKAIQKHIVENKHLSNSACVPELGELIDRFLDKNPNVDTILLGCTDLPTLLPDRNYPVPFLDPLDVLVDLCIAYYNGL